MQDRRKKAIAGKMGGDRYPEDSSVGPRKASLPVRDMAADIGPTKNGKARGEKPPHYPAHGERSR